MGMAATYDQKVFCRQALIGGNYGLLNATTFIPNPDYYGALLWHRLMGSTVLAVTKESDPDLRVYAHCAKKKPGSRDIPAMDPRLVDASAPIYVAAQSIAYVTVRDFEAPAWDDPNLMSKILDPLYLSQVSHTYKGVLNVVNKFRPQSGAWVSESGGAFNSGIKDVSPTFVDGFWYLDQMGMAATYDQKVFCRQALIGGNYGLLNATTFIPNPDYYGALLWHRLMGSTVLAVTRESDPDLRVYAHCAKKKIVQYNPFDLKSEDDGKPNYEFVGKQNREEYHLTSLFGKMKGGIVCLNDVPMVQPGSRDIPTMDPRLVDASAQIYVAAQSIAYVTVRDFKAPACVKSCPVKLMFGLNALSGRNESRTEKGEWIGDWQPQNTRDFVKYTISKGYKVDSYEFGNQLCGSGIGARVDANQYGKDTIVLKNLVKELYADPETRLKVLGPGCFYDEKWLNTFLEVSGRGVVDGVTHHIYNLGPGAWVSESGGAFNNGSKDVSPTFVDGFCALLWHQLMGSTVLAVTKESDPYLRVYAHCAKKKVSWL
ncbi:hypothetical protein GQ457_01G017330 [Hibiscus cannabinus]